MTAPVSQVLSEADSLGMRCLGFVQEQSGGEWGPDLEHGDALKLLAFVRQEITAALAKEQGR